MRTRFTAEADGDGRKPSSEASYTLDDTLKAAIFPTHLKIMEELCYETKMDKIE